MLEDARNVLAESRRQVTDWASQNGLNKPADKVDEMIVGDVTINQQAPQQSEMGTLAKLALAGALAAGTGGAGLGAGVLLDKFLKDGEQVVAPDSQTIEIDRDWKLGEPIVE